eukprot:364786-Chlamydomonas_euryale.AAC.29
MHLRLGGGPAGGGDHACAAGADTASAPHGAAAAGSGGGAAALARRALHPAVVQLAGRPVRQRRLPVQLPGVVVALAVPQAQPAARAACVQGGHNVPTGKPPRG